MAIKLQVQSRDILGKEVKQLRHQGILPAHLYGHNIPSLSLQMDMLSAERIVDRAGSSHLVALTVDKARKPRNVLLREIQRDPRTGRLVHVDFYEVSMTEEITLDVPVTLAGEAPLKLKDLVLEQGLRVLSIKCLPDRIPDEVKVDVTSLADAGQAIHVRDIKLGPGVALLNDPEEIVARVVVLAVAVEEEKVPVAEAEAEKAEAAEGAGAEEKQG